MTSQFLAILYLSKLQHFMIHNLHLKFINYMDDYIIIHQDKKYLEYCLNILVEYGLPFVRVQGKFLCMKGSNTETEVKEAQNAIWQLGGRIKEIKEFTIGKEQLSRSVIVIEEIKETPMIYPRKAGKPSKEPII